MGRADTDVVAALRAEVKRLRTEVARLRGRLAKDVKTGQDHASTTAANIARSDRSAALDAQVVLVARELLSREFGVAVMDLSRFGFPRFYSFPRLRSEIAETLNDRGIPAPRGGPWSVRQVQRALERHSQRQVVRAAPPLARKPLQL